ncbi:MAG: crotonase/enoyl-CoA hydratase family protein [Bacteroidota bacterium]
MEYEFLKVRVEGGIAEVEMHRPEKANAIDWNAFTEIQRAFEQLGDQPEVRAIILRGAGKHFCAGIDLSLLMGLNEIVASDCEGRKRERLRKLIFQLQAPVNAIADCPQPVMAAIQGGCIGAGLDIAAACDMRYCTPNAYFTIKEIDMGMVADLGVLQRLPGIIPEGILREMAYTARKIPGEEAVRIGLVNRAYPDPEGLLAGVREIAQRIAAKSPLSIRGNKEILNYNRRKNIDEGLNYIAIWNAAMLLSEDLTVAGRAAALRQQPKFHD